MTWLMEGKAEIGIHEAESGIPGADCKDVRCCRHLVLKGLAQDYRSQRAASGI